MYVLEPDTWERLTFLTGKLSVSVSCANYTEVGNYFWEQARFLGAMRHIMMGLGCIQYVLGPDTCERLTFFTGKLSIFVSSAN